MTTIAARRKGIGITQQVLAERIGVTQSCIARWEKGVTEPPIATLVKLADIFNCTIDELIEGRNAHARDDSAIPRPGRGRVLQRSTARRTGR